MERNDISLRGKKISSSLGFQCTGAHTSKRDLQIALEYLKESVCFHLFFCLFKRIQNPILFLLTQQIFFFKHQLARKQPSQAKPICEKIALDEFNLCVYLKNSQAKHQKREKKPFKTPANLATIIRIQEIQRRGAIHIQKLTGPFYK